MTIDKALRKQVVARWHRRFALFVSAWLAVLAATGVVINHAHDLGLDHSPAPGSIQRLFYGIDIESSGDNFCNTVKGIGPECARIFARLALPSGALLLGDSSLFILDDKGQLVEKLGAGQFGLAGLNAVLSQDSYIYLGDGQRIVRADSELMAWEVLDTATAEALTGGDWQASGDAAHVLSWERFMLDLHAARFLGPFAKFFNDLVAGLILILALSGIWLFRLKRNGNGV